VERPTPTGGPAFEPERVQVFVVEQLEADPESGRAQLHYRFDDGPRFTEHLDFGPRRVADPALDEGFLAALRLVHLVAGVSYYKAALPPVVEVQGPALGPAVERLAQAVYDQGLRELKLRNGLPVEQAPVFLATGGRSPEQPGPTGGPPPPPPPGLGIPVGGGKDSALVVAALRESDPVLLSVNPPPAARRVAAAAGLPLVEIRRRLDPELLVLNQRGAWNGHVPITAVVALVAAAAGYRLGYATTVLALESSADEPTRLVAGPDGRVVAVNHQWSKSRELEPLLGAALVETLGPAVSVRSALRAVPELDVAAAFAALPEYHRAFLSCNRAFVAGAEDRWCGDCPKCRFVFLALAPNLRPEELAGIFGRNLLDDPSQLAGFAALLDPEDKPFECVGTRGESAAALAALAEQPRWAGASIVAQLAPRARALAEASGLWPWRPASPEAVLGAVREAVGLEATGARRGA
jgi:hypothetical protein